MMAMPTDFDSNSTLVSLVFADFKEADRDFANEVDVEE
jgi:hypothetical protein